MEARVEEYVLNIIEATRYPDKYRLTELKDAVQFGVSPRATQNLMLASKAQAFLNGRAYVTPQDVKSVGKDVLSHRIILNNRAETLGFSQEAVVQKILDHMPLV